MLSHARIVIENGFHPGLWSSSNTSVLFEVTDEVRSENDFIPC